MISFMRLLVLYCTKYISSKIMKGLLWHSKNIVYYGLAFKSREVC